MSDTSTAVRVRETGTVKFFNGKDGFGFIRADNGERDVFLSVNVLPRGFDTSILKDQRCSYVRGEGRKGKGPAAEDFQLL